MRVIRDILKIRFDVLEGRGVGKYSFIVTDHLVQFVGVLLPSSVQVPAQVGLS